MSLKIQITCDVEDCESFLDIGLTDLTDSFGDIIGFASDHGWDIVIEKPLHSETILCCCPQHKNKEA